MSVLFTGGKSIFHSNSLVIIQIAVKKWPFSISSEENGSFSSLGVEKGHFLHGNLIITDKLQ